MTSTNSQVAVPWHRRILYGLTNWGLFGAGAANLVIGTWSAVNSQVSIAAASLTAGLVLLLAATVDRFESLKGLGVEAKTRQLDRKIEQADDALRRLKELAELTGTTLVSFSSKMGRLNSAPGPREAYGLAQKVHSLFAAVGSDPRQIRQALNPWISITCHDLAKAIAAPIHDALREKISELQSKLPAVRDPIDPNDRELAGLRSDINDGQTYLDQRLRRIHRLEADDYPDQFLNLFEAVPLVDSQTVANARDKAKRFATDMVALRETLKLYNPEPWFSEIERHRWG